MGEKEITIEIKRPEIIVLLIFFSILLFLEIRITINSPIAFGDEGFHTRIAQWIGQEREYPVWLPFIGTKLVRSGFYRPPLWNILEGSFYLLFGFNDIIVKVLTPFIASILIGLVIFLLVKEIYSKEVGFIAAIIIVTIPSIVTYSVLFYTDILFTFYFCLFIFTFILSIKTENKKYWAVAGVFSALTLLTKSPGVIVVPFLVVLFFLYQVHKEGFSKKLKNYLVLILFLILISGSYFIRNFVYYGTPHCNFPLFSSEGCQKTFEYKNIKELPSGTAGGGSSESILKIGIMNYLNFVYGRIWFIPLSFICGLFYIGVRKNNFNVLIFLIILSFLPIFYVSLSSITEDLSRSTLSFASIVALISGIYFSGIYKYISKIDFAWVGTLVFLMIDFLIIFYNYIAISSVLSIILGFGLFIASAYFLYQKNYKYAMMATFFSFIILFSFTNFYDKITGMVQVKQFVPSFFDACNFIKQNTTNDVLILTVWDYATTYNTQRNVYQLTGLPDSGDIMLSGDVNLTLSRLKAHGVTHIFVQKFSINANYYPVEFINFLEDNPKKFVKIYETGSDLQQCIQSGGCDGNILYQIKY